MSGFEMTRMTLTSCQTQSVQSIAMFHNQNCFDMLLPQRKPDLHRMLP